MLSVIVLIATNVSGIMASVIMPIVVTPNFLLWRNKLDSVENFRPEANALAPGLKSGRKNSTIAMVEFLRL
jgi:hypothetical protein